jgi:hypothetical protein
MARMQPSPFNIGAGGAPLGQLKSRAGNFAANAALIVRLLLRKDTGLRILSWSNIIVTFLGMMALHWFDNAHFGLYTLFGGGVMYGNNTALRNFALAWLALAVFEHFKRLDEEKRGVEPHNFSPGISRLGLGEFIPYGPKVIAVAVEPALAFLLGALLRRLGFSMLGWVVIASALCFAVCEWRLYQQVKEHRRDMRDMGKEAQWETEFANQSAATDGPAHEPEAMDTGMDGLDQGGGKPNHVADEAVPGGAL